MERKQYPSSILSYVKKESHTFQEKPFGFLDGFVYAICSYFLFEKSAAYHNDKPLSFKQTIGALEGDALANLFWFNDIAPLFRDALLESPRYKESSVSYAEAMLDTQEYGQFAACCIHVPDGSLFLSFRGTDDTITGWEENFTMSVLDKTIGQEQARNFTLRMFDTYCRTNPYSALRLGGHSKGGNLAFYAALTEGSTLGDSLIRAYSFDGPGFTQSFLDRYASKDITIRLTKITPSYSFFGSFFNDAVVPRGITSNEWGLMEHMPFSWIIKDNDFEWAMSSSPLTSITDKTFTRWLDALSLDDRITFLSILFGTVEYAASTNHIGDLPRALIKKAPAITHAFQTFDEPFRKNLTKVLSALISGFAESTQEVITERAQLP